MSGVRDYARKLAVMQQLQRKNQAAPVRRGGRQENFGFGDVLPESGPINKDNYIIWLLVGGAIAAGAAFYYFKYMSPQAQAANMGQSILQGTR